MLQVIVITALVMMARVRTGGKSEEQEEEDGAGEWDLELEGPAEPDHRKES